jgi:hypothetical protein
MKSNRRSRSGLHRGLGAVALGALTLGSLILGSLALQPTGGPEDAPWPFTRIAESARLRAGLSAVRPGDVAVIQFSLGAFRGSQIFRPGRPVSTEIGCASRAAVREGTRLDTMAHGTLDYDAERDVYTYLWVTSATWEGTCRRLTLDFADGSVHEALVWFGDPFGVVAQAPLPR